MDYPEEYQIKGYWHISSGCRTAYMLAAMADARKYKRLKKHFKLESPPTNNQTDHWTIFKDIANSDNFKTNWHSKILFFGGAWLKDNNLRTITFRAALLERLRKSSIFMRNIDSSQKIWQDFFLYIKTRNKKVDDYILHLVRYILDAAFGSELSFQLADQSSEGGPFFEIAQSIDEIYGMDKYLPLIVYADYFKPGISQYSYTSIQMNPLRIRRKVNSNTYYLQDDFREAQWVINEYIKFANKVLFSKEKKYAQAYNADRYFFEFYSAFPEIDKAIYDVTQLFKNDHKLEDWSNMRYNEVYGRSTFMRTAVKFGLK